MKKIALAFINVHDKTGVVELGSFLIKKGVEVVSVGSTLKLLEKNGVKAMDLTAFAGPHDALDEKQMNLHPAIFSGVAVNRREQSQLDHLKKIGGRPIDLVVLNPMPLETHKPEAEPGEAQPDPFNIFDVSSLALVRAAAKSYADVAPLTNPEQYAQFMDEFTKHSGNISADFRRRLALAALELSASYDISIYKHLYSQSYKDQFLPDTLFLTYKKAMDLRYGENPHQKACFYKETDLYGVSMADTTILKGGPLNYNLAYDLNLALEVVMEFDKTAAVVIKGGVPVGVAMDKDMCRAYMHARDIEGGNAAMGAVVAFNGQVEKRTAKELATSYIEAVIAPKFTDGALEHFKSAKKLPNMRVIQVAGKKWTKQAGTLNIKSMLGGVLVQENNDLLLPDGAHMKLLSKRKLTRKQLADLIIAWKVCKHCGSNAVVLASDMQTIGTGCGHSNRSDAMKAAFEKAGEKAMGAVMAFDTTIPYRNIIDEAAHQGISAIIQPGGAMRDDEIVLACDEHNIALAITGMRHFKH